MTTLRNTIETLASQFAANVIAALRGVSIEELVDVSKGGRTPGGGGARRGRPPRAASGASGPAPARRGKGGRLGRRSPNEIGKMVDAIVELLGKHPKGLRSEQIRDALGVQRKELPRPLADGLTAGRLSKQGQKRATTYFSGGKKRGGPRAKKAG